LIIAAMQQFALIALCMHRMHAAVVSLQNLAANAKWAWFSFNMMSEKCFCCFAFVEYILLKNSDILQSICELKCCARSAIEPKY